MKALKRLLAVLASAAVIAAAAFLASSDGSTGRGAVTLWCVEGSAVTEAMKEYADEYDSMPKRAGLPVEIRTFESDEKLAEAFEINSPDILLCAHTRAFSLSERGKLTDISADMYYDPQYSQTVAGRNTSIGKSFFPIGFDIPVLVINSALCGKSSFDSLEAMLLEASEYTSETGKPFFGSDSFSELFALTLLRSGKTFGADFENESGRQYVDLYNLLARAAFDGSMYTKTGDMARYVSAGALPCALVDSSSLAGGELDGVTLSDVPSPVDAVNGDTVGTAVGLAVTNGGSRSTSDIGAFISWFFEKGKCEDCARKGALAPAQTTADATTDALSQKLSDIAENAVVSLADPSSAYALNSEDFDILFSSAMQKLR